MRPIFISGNGISGWRTSRSRSYKDDLEDEGALLGRFGHAAHKLRLAGECKRVGGETQIKDRWTGHCEQSGGARARRPMRRSVKA
jgi:hypothetical protein